MCILEPEEKETSVKYKLYKPNNDLSDFVKYYWQFELDSIPQEIHANRVIPSGELQIIFHYKTPFRELDRYHQSFVQPQCLICGQQTDYKDIFSVQAAGMLAVVFHPYALRAFFPAPVNEFTDQSISLDNFFRTETKELQERMIEASDIHARILLVENFLLNRLLISNSFSVVKEAVNMITEMGGQLTVSEAANKLNVSKRQFERVFLANVGVSPKKFGRIVRFSHSIKLLAKPIPLTTLAYEAGYSDQSHLIHDFKAFAGLSPKAFVRQTCHTPE